MAYDNKGGDNRKGSAGGGNNRTPGRSYEKKPYNKEGGGYRQDKPYRKDGEGGGYRQDKPYRKDGEGGGYRQDKPYRKDGEGGGYRQDKPYRKDENSSYRQQDAFYKKAYPKDDPVVEAQPTALVDELPYLIMGRNAVKEALRSGRSIDRILVNKDQDGSLRELVGMTRDRNIQLREVEKGKLDEMCMPFGHGSRPGNHQGIVAQVPGVEYCDISDILAEAKKKGEPPFIVLLDGVEDPHNLGSIMRSAECAGAHGVIIPKRRSAGVTAAACKASAGAVEYIKVARVSNLVGAMERIKDEGVWLFGADMKGTPMTKADMKGAAGLVIGGEGSGLSQLVREKCDFLISIPMFGSLESLNAAVAAAILMFEKKRQG